MPSGPILTWTPEHSEKAEEYLQYFIDSAMDEEPSYNQFQESFLLNNGLNGNYNPTIAKLILTQHGHHINRPLIRLLGFPRCNNGCQGCVNTQMRRIRRICQHLPVIEQPHIPLRLPGDDGAAGLAVR